MYKSLTTVAVLALSFTGFAAHAQKTVTGPKGGTATGSATGSGA